MVGIDGDRAGPDLSPETIRFAAPAMEEPAPAPRSRRLHRFLLVTSAVLLLVAALTAGGLYWLSERLGNNVQRVPDVFNGIEDANRPTATEALTFLLVGTDSRSPDPTTGEDATGPQFVPGGQRADVMMLVRLSADRSHAAVVSIPRDSWVPVPGRGMAKINAAFSWGGPTLAVQTVEALTKVRIDHFAVIDFAGFQAMTDSVGGIDVNVAKTTSSRGVTFTAGPNHLNGDQALVYVRQRYELPRGDLDRVQRQQNAMRALVKKAFADGALGDIGRTYGLVDSISQWVSVDDTLSNQGLRELAFSLRDLRPGGLSYLTAPVSGLGREGAQSVVYLDKRHTTELWPHLQAADVRPYLAKYPEDALPEAPP